MRKTLLALSVAIVATTAVFSQVQVGKTGRVTIGIDYLKSSVEPEPFDSSRVVIPIYPSTPSSMDIGGFDFGTMPSYYNDTITPLQIFGPLPDNGGSRITFGVRPFSLPTSRPVTVGELGDTASTGKLWLHGTNGIYLTAGATVSDTVAFYDKSKGRFFQFNCDVQSTGVFIPSDSRFKTNIEPVGDVSSELGALSAVSYRLKPDFGNAPAAMSASSLSSSGDAGSLRYGFLAEEVESVLPCLVHTDSAGYKFVDYMGMIPLLVESIKQMQARTDSLESVIANMQNPTAAPRQSVAKSGGNSLDAELFQNTPNPFSVSTEIRCVLPYEAKSACIYVYDLQGSQKKKIELSGRGTVTATIRSFDLAAGMYIYALIVDGNEIDSKRMILTD